MRGRDAKSRAQWIGIRVQARATVVDAVAIVAPCRKSGGDG